LKLGSSSAECDTILRRLSWIPSYDEWIPKLGLEVTESDDGDDLIYHVMQDNIRDVDFDALMQKPIVVFWPETSSFDYSNSDVLPQLYASSSSSPPPFPTDAKETVGDLFRWGVPFAYGMAFRYLFDFSDRIKRTQISTTTASAWSSEVGTDTEGVTTTATTIAVHSRHTDPRELGCNVTRELECVRGLLEKQQEKQDEHQQQQHQQQRAAPCQVYVMADRKCTLSSLQKELVQVTTTTKRRYSCSVHVAEHEEVHSRVADHGDFASAGYFQDLFAVSQHVRHGLVVAHVPGERIRTSSTLVWELIEFNRRVDSWRRQQRSTAAADNYGGDLNLCKYVELHRAKQKRLNDKVRGRGWQSQQ